MTIDYRVSQVFFTATRDQFVIALSSKPLASHLRTDSPDVAGQCENQERGQLQIPSRRTTQGVLDSGQVHTVILSPSSSTLWALVFGQPCKSYTLCGTSGVGKWAGVAFRASLDRTVCSWYFLIEIPVRGSPLRMKPSEWIAHNSQCIYIYIYIYVYIHTCITYIYIYIYIHTACTPLSSRAERFGESPGRDRYAMIW